MMGLLDDPTRITPHMQRTQGMNLMHRQQMLGPKKPGMSPGMRTALLTSGLNMMQQPNMNFGGFLQGMSPVIAELLAKKRNMSSLFGS